MFYTTFAFLIILEMKYSISVLFLFCFCCSRAQVNLNAGLVAYYPFSGNTNDASGNGNNATNFGATLTTDQGGNANSAYYFDGSDYMRIANTPQLNSPTQLTLAAKVKVNGFYNGLCYGNCIIDKGTDDFNPGNYALRFTPNAYTLSCNVYDTIHQNYIGFGANAIPASAMNNLPYIVKDQWDCLIFTFDGTVNRLYVNGTLRYQVNGSLPIGVNSEDVFLGRKNNTQYPYWFKGVMDEVRIYNRALNIQEIDSLCSFAPPPPSDTIINKYGAVLEKLPCSNTLVIDTATDFNVGDTILMIQMKGAVIDSSNTAAFGTVIDYQGAGNYEYNVIKAKTGNAVTLKHPIVRDYNIPEGKVQIVRVPSFQNYTVNQPHTCMPWNGNKGGVFIINVANTLSLNNRIDVSGRGFRGATNTVVSNSTINCDITPYYMGSNVDSGGMKGEGIAMVSTAKSYGRGRLGNGGGGGNGHNAGGGGGSNGNTGGIGGRQYYNCSTSTLNTTGGVPGLQLPYSNASNKIFLGGGGGGSQANNGTLALGGNGGGICIVTAGTLTGVNQNLVADGGDALGCINNGTPGVCHDGMGGGGGGGTILVNCTNVSGSVTTKSSGGKGGDEAASSIYGEVGPGGGGSGGVAWFKSASLPSAVTVTVPGGLNGIVVYNGSAWGAQPGLPGQSVTGLQLNFPVDTFSGGNLIVDFSDTAIDCFTYKFNDLTAPSGAIVSRNWDFAGGGTSVLQAPTFTFPGYGSFPVTLTVTDSSGCHGSITKDINIPYIHFAHAGNDTAVCDGGIATLRASGGVSYSWSPATGLSNPNAATTSAVIEGTTSYIVTVKNSRGCIDSDTVTIGIATGSPVSILSDGEIISCRNSSVQLTATGASAYVWHPGIYCDDSTSASPKVMPSYTTLFTVVGTSAEGCTSQDTVTVISYNGNAQLFMPNAFTPNADGKNDKIRPVILCGFRMEQFAIFNRWGERVFVTSSPTEGWDGFYKNKPADVGTYYYYIKGKKEDRTTQTFKGDILLIR